MKKNCNFLFNKFVIELSSIIFQLSFHDGETNAKINLKLNVTIFNKKRGGRKIPRI